MSTMTIPEAFRALARYVDELAAALEGKGGPSVHREEAQAAKPRPTKAAEPKPAAPRAPALEPLPDRDDFTRTEVKILTALAQAGHALTMPQMGTRSGLSSGTGSFKQALAALRREAYVHSQGAKTAITDDGVEALGTFARLPEGEQLFDYWCHKAGGTCAKILGALRTRHRERSGPATADELGLATALSSGTGSFGQALAKLRRLELIEGGGDSMVLSDSLRNAIAPTISVFDTKSGKTHRVKAQ